MTVHKRRRRNITLFSVVCLLTIWISVLCHRNHTDIRHFSGWLMFALIVFLAAFNLRQRLSFLPVLRASTWLQLHIYLGLFCGLIFVIHIGAAVPNGPLEITLALLFLIVFVSGIVGLALSRSLPNRLTNQGEEIIFERIPIYRRQLRDKAEELVLSSLTSSQSKMLAEFYSEELALFFVAPAYLLHHLFMAQRPLNQILEKIDNQKRYCNDSECELIEQLRELVVKTYELDRSQYLQGILKVWLFIHIPATFALFAFIVLHVILIHVYVGTG